MSLLLSLLPRRPATDAFPLPAPPCTPPHLQLEALREENRSLREASRGGSALGAARRPPVAAPDAPTSSHLFRLEQELLEVRAELQALSKRLQATEEKEGTANERARQAEERSTSLTMELAKSRAEVRAGAILAGRGGGEGAAGGGARWGKLAVGEVLRHYLQITALLAVCTSVCTYSAM